MKNTGQTERDYNSSEESGTIHEKFQMEFNSGNGEQFETFSDLYEHYREEFIQWLSRRVKAGDLSERAKKDYISAVDRYLVEADDDITKPLEIRDMSGDKQTRGVRNFFNFLEDIEVENPLGYSLDKWRKNVKIRPSGVVEIYPSDEEIVEAYNACPPEYKTFFKALVYTGNRFSQLYAALKEFNSDELTYAENTAHISSANLSHGTKRSYRLFFPAAFIPELKKIRLQNPEYIKRGIQHGRVSAKTIRKWHYNFMISHGISQAAADFMQGRAPATVGTANYLDKIRLSTGAYQSVVDLFPLSPTAGEKITHAAGRTEEPQPKPKQTRTPKKGKTPATAETLNALFASHKDGFYRYCAEHNIGMAQNHGRALYNTHGSKASKFFSTAPEIRKPTDIPTVTDKKQVTALRLFIGEYLPATGVKAPLGHPVDEWKNAVSYVKN